MIDNLAGINWAALERRELLLDGRLLPLLSKINKGERLTIRDLLPLNTVTYPPAALEEWLNISITGSILDKAKEHLEKMALLEAGLKEWVEHIIAQPEELRPVKIKVPHKGDMTSGKVQIFFDMEPHVPGLRVGTFLKYLKIKGGYNGQLEAKSKGPRHLVFDPMIANSDLFSIFLSFLSLFPADWKMIRAENGENKWCHKALMPIHLMSMAGLLSAKIENPIVPSELESTASLFLTHDDDTVSELAKFILLIARVRPLAFEAYSKFEEPTLIYSELPKSEW